MSQTVADTRYGGGEIASESIARRLATHAVVVSGTRYGWAEVASIPNAQDGRPTLRQLWIDTLEGVRR